MFLPFQKTSSSLNIVEEKLHFNSSFRRASITSSRSSRFSKYETVLQNKDFGTDLIPQSSIFVLLQTSLAQGIDKAFLVGSLVIEITVPIYILQGDFGVYFKNLCGFSTGFFYTACHAISCC